MAVHDSSGYPSGNTDKHLEHEGRQVSSLVSIADRMPRGFGGYQRHFQGLVFRDVLLVARA